MSRTLRSRADAAQGCLKKDFRWPVFWSEYHETQMHAEVIRCACVLFALAWSVRSGQSADELAPRAMRHSDLVLGSKTALIGEDGKAEWEYRGGSRDVFVLPSGNVLIAFKMIGVTPEKKIVWACDHPMAVAVHHFPILTTNGKPKPGRPLK